MAHNIGNYQERELKFNLIFCVNFGPKTCFLRFPIKLHLLGYPGSIFKTCRETFIALCLQHVFLESWILGRSANFHELGFRIGLKNAWHDCFDSCVWICSYEDLVLLQQSSLPYLLYDDLSPFPPAHPSILTRTRPYIRPNSFSSCTRVQGSSKSR